MRKLKTRLSTSNETLSQSVFFFFLNIYLDVLSLSCCTWDL